MWVLFVPVQRLLYNGVWVLLVRLVRSIRTSTKTFGSSVRGSLGSQKWLLTMDGLRPYDASPTILLERKRGREEDIVGGCGCIHVCQCPRRWSVPHTRNTNRVLAI